MRRQFLGALLFAGTLAFTACQNETTIYVDENGNPIENVELKEGEGLLKINLSNTSANSRTARPVGSSAAANNVNTVKVYVYSSTTDDDSSYTLDTNAQLKSGQEGSISINGGIITITSYDGEEEHTNDTDVNHAVATIKLTGLTAGKYYKFVAVGYNASEAGGENPYGVSTFSSFSTTTSQEKTGYGVEELFAGVSTEMQTTDKANFATSPSITMERQVAGMLGYFTKVPTKINDKVVKYVKVYANKGFKKFKYPSLKDFNGDESSAVSENNGKTELLSFDMQTIATNWNSGSPQGDNYEFANCSETGLSEGNLTASQTAPLATSYTAPAGLKLVENSIFGGCYIIPYDKHYASGDSNGMLSTLTVELQDGSNSTLKTLKVYTNQESTQSVDKYFYDIRRNNFYSIGQKLDTDTTTPTDPEGPDEPIDLSSNTNIVVIINDAWEVLHNMGVEE